MKHATIAYLVRQENDVITQVLMALKKRGFGISKWNGFGGKQEPDETIEQTMIRESQEEIGITPVQYKQVAELEYQFESEPDSDQIDYVYFITEWEGEPIESEEMQPKWYKPEELPKSQMWKSQSIWLPVLLDGNEITGKMVYDGNKNLKSFNLKF